MPQFAPGESKTAIAPIMVKPAGLSCEAEIFLGPDELTKVATSGRIPFTSTGAEQDVSLPVTMPAMEGTFHVYADVYAEGLLVAAYQALEDVVIVYPIVPWGYSDVRCSIGPGPAAWSSVDFSAKITNIGSLPATKTVTLYWRRVDIAGSWMVSKSIELTLVPGETYQFTSDPEAILIYPGMRFELYLVDSDGYESAHCFASL